MEESIVQYFGEIHDKIKVLNLVLQPIVKDNNTSFKLTVQKDGLIVTRGTDKYVIPFKGFSVQHFQTQVLTIVNSLEVHLRLEIAIKEVSQTHVLDNYEDILTTTDEKQQVFNIKCKRCHSPITHMNRIYDRVLDLPSENWQEYLDNWCCHGNDAINQLKDGLNPRSTDCFLGSWYILVHNQAIDVESSEIEKGESSYSVICKRCLNVVGEVDSFPDNASCIKLYKYAISMTTKVNCEETDVFRDFGEEIYMGRKLVSLTKSRLCHKFIVKCTKKLDKTTPCMLLLWVLNTDARLLLPSKNGKYTDVVPVVKILYKSHLDKDFEKQKQDWYKRNETDIITFPMIISLKLLLLLDENNKKQPISMQETNNFKTTYLKIKMIKADEKMYSKLDK